MHPCVYMLVTIIDCRGFRLIAQSMASNSPQVCTSVSTLPNMKIWHVDEYSKSVKMKLFTIKIVFYFACHAPEENIRCFFVL